MQRRPSSPRTTDALAVGSSTFCLMLSYIAKLLAEISVVVWTCQWRNWHEWQKTERHGEIQRKASSAPIDQAWPVEIKSSKLSLDLSVQWPGFVLCIHRLQHDVTFTGWLVITNINSQTFRHPFNYFEF